MGNGAESSAGLGFRHCLGSQPNGQRLDAPSSSCKDRGWMKSVSGHRTRYRRLPLVIVALILVAVATCYVLINTVKHRLITSTGESLALAASDISDKLDTFFFERMGDATILASATELQSADPAKLSKHLETVRATYQVYEWLAITDSNGKVIASTDPGEIGSEQGEAEWYQPARQSPAVQVQEVAAPGKGVGERAVLFAKSVPGHGVIVARSGLPATDPLFEGTMRAFQSLSSTNARLAWRIVARDGRLLHESRRESGSARGPIQNDSTPAVVKKPGWTERLDSIRNVPVIQGYAPTQGHGEFPGLGWSVMVEMDRADALASMHRVLWQIFLVGSAIVLPLFGLASWSVLRLRRDWIRLGESQAHLATTLRSIAEGVILTDIEGRITMLNGAAETLTGWRDANAKGKHFREVVRVLDRESRQPLEPLTTEVVRRESTVIPGTTVLLVSQDGTERMVIQSASPIPGNGGVAGVALICRDVTERELADTAFRASQKTFRLISENMSDVITLLDLEGRVLFQSRNQYNSLLPDVSRGEGVFDYVVEEDRPLILGSIQRLAETGEPQRLEFRIRKPDSSVLVVESVGTLVRQADGQPERIVAVSRDVTKRREIERHLVEEKEFNDTLLASLPGIFFMCDPQRRLLRWNRNFELVTGHTPDEVAELDLLTFFPHQEQQHMQECIGLSLRAGKSDVETAVWHRNGRLTAYYISGIRCEIEKQPAVLCVGIDISGRKAAEEALLATSQRLDRQNHALGEQARNPALRGDNLSIAFHTITEVASRTLGVARTSIWFYQRDDAAIHCEDLFDYPTGRHTQGSIIHSAQNPAYFQALAEGRVIPAHYARNDPRTKEFLESYLKPLGITSMLDAPIRLEGRMIGVICHEHTGSPREWTLDEQNFAGSMADLVALSLEVWQRRQAESALREARDQLEIKVAERTRELSEANDQLKELDRLKSEFLAMMSHELRTPMNSIIGFTGILRQELAGPLNDEQKKQLGMVHFSARHLLDLINDLLDLSRIESGKMDVSLEEVEVAEVARQVIESLQPAATQKGLSLTSEIVDPGREILTDRKRAYQILLNLTNNAVKFTDKGSIKIVIQNQGSGVQFEVIDTGIGIKPEQLANLFQAFRQVDGSARRVYEGTGLGLYLCKKLVNMLGGSIGAESNFGVGSRFYFTLPATPPPSNTQ
jgi:PAS domain S-box-containing protein